MVVRDLIDLLKKGSKASLTAAVVNFIIGVAKFFAYLITGNVAMFAEMMHSLGDSINQFFVWIGSSLSNKAPTKRFPYGFGRLVNMVCLFAIVVVGILAYETVREGIHHIIEPLPGDTEFTHLLINVGVLGVAFVLEMFVLYKAGKELLHDAGMDASGIRPFTVSYLNSHRAKPATKLVFLEDTVAVLGGLLAIVAILIGYYTPFQLGEGIASVIIGLMMFYIVFKIFMENAAGVLGEHDAHMEGHISKILLNHERITDINNLIIMKEGEFLHIEGVLEVDRNLNIDEANALRDELGEILLAQNNIKDVDLIFKNDDGMRAWPHTQDEIDHRR